VKTVLNVKFEKGYQINFIRRGYTKGVFWKIEQ